MAFQFNNVQEVDVSVKFSDVAGNEVVVSNVVWGSTEGQEIVTVIPVEGSANAVIVRSTGKVGACAITVVAEYDFNGSPTVVSGEAQIEVVDSGEVLVSFSFGEPRHV